MNFTTVLLSLVLFAGSAAAECTPIQKLFGGCPSVAKSAAQKAAAVEFVPKFERVGVVNEYYAQVRPINSRYFASEETALALMEKFGAFKLEYQPTLNNLGAKYVYMDGLEEGKLAVYRFLVFGAGTFLRDAHGVVVANTQAEFKVNAGVLADEYLRNPESEHPAQDYVYGYPPVTGHYLSNAEQGVWNILTKLAAAAEAQKSAEVEGK